MRSWLGWAAACLLSSAACGGDGEPGDAPETGGTAGTSASGGGAGSGSTGGTAGASGGAGAADAGPLDAAPDAPGDATSDAPVDAGPSDAAPTTVTLLKQLGEVFTPTASETLKKLGLGTKGTVYLWVRVALDVKVGDFQPEIPDPGATDRTEHILFGLFRANQTQSDQRYLMGSAAVSFATKAPHFRMFGRKSIGAGYTTYTSWSTTYAWNKGATYHLDCLLDGVAHIQRCELSLGGSIVKALEGSVAYLDPAAHLSTGFYVELGTGKPGDIEASPIGWTFSNLVVTAAALP